MSTRQQGKKGLSQEMQMLREENGRLHRIVEQLKAEIRVLSAENQTLKSQIAKNSHNSGKPPSSDGYNKPKPKSQRKRSGKKVGGQEGHEGVTLEPVENPDVIEKCEVGDICERCGASLEDVETITHKCRQQVDVTPSEPQVTEFQAEVKKCVTCGFLNVAKFPKGITHRVQYGPRVKAYAAYFNHYQYLPYERSQEIFQDCFSLHLSQGTLVNAIDTCHKKLEASSEHIKQAIISSKQAHFDETGLRVKKKLHWLHSASTQRLTHYDIHQKRGHLAMDDIGILPDFSGCAIHDHLKSYFTYACEHSLCNAHHIRELVYSEEQFDQQWAMKMRKFLVEIKDIVENRKVLGHTELTLSERNRFSRKYSRILREGLPEIPEVPPPENKRGKPKQHKSKNLLDRLRDYKRETLRFMYNFDIPFDNNLAERDIRPTKVKQKISGCFRSKIGSERFCRIRGYISTVRKNDMHVLQSLTSVFQGTPMLPKFLEENNG